MRKPFFSYTPSDAERKKIFAWCIKHVTPHEVSATGMERRALRRSSETLAGRASFKEAADSNAEIVHCKSGDGQKKVGKL
jgi:hypothetical protein